MIQAQASTRSRSQFVLQTYLVVLSALFVGSLFLKGGQDVLLINGLHNEVLDAFFKNITNLGDGVIFVPIIIVTLFVRFKYTIVALIACGANGAISPLCKKVLFVSAGRPKALIDNDLLYFVPGVQVHEAHSFPSGHTITIFCAAVFVSLLARNFFVAIFCLVVALMVGMSRIYLAQHFLADVAAGAIIGSFTTFVIWQLIENFSRKRWMNARIVIPQFKAKKKVSA